MKIGELLRSRAGKINWFGLFLLAFFGLLIYGATVFFPIYKGHFELKRFVDEQVLQSGMYEARQIDENITQKAVALGANPADIGINVTKANGKISIDCQYKRTVNFLWMQVTRPFTIRIINETIRMPDSLQPHKQHVAGDND